MSFSRENVKWNILNNSVNCITFPGTNGQNNSISILFLWQDDLRKNSQNFQCQQKSRANFKT